VVAQTRRVVTGSETGSLHGVRLALLGLTFKAGTDDLRDSPSLGVARMLAELGADLTGYDPCVPVDRSEQVAPVTVSDDPYRAAKGASAVLLLTEWPRFRDLDWARMAALMESPEMLDTRDQVSASALAEAGFRWHKLGGRAGGVHDD
jgi:UDPglucose 6-dehydrogenase